MNQVSEKIATANALATARSEAIADAIKATKGKFFKVGFIKKDGSLREMVARVGVHAGLTGGRADATAKRKETNEALRQVTVYSMGDHGYRVVSCDKLVYFKCGNDEIRA